MIKVVIYIALFIFSSILNSQKKGNELRDNGELEKAIKAYKKEIKIAGSNYERNYNVACIYAIMYKKDSAFHYLNIALKNHKTLWPLSDNDLYPLTDDKRWLAIEDKLLKNNQLIDNKIIDIEYTKKLLRLIMKDQVLDYHMDMAKKYFYKLSKAPHWYYPIAQMKKEIASENYNTMEKLIADKGWPKYSNVGKIAADAPLLVINHHPDDHVRVKYIDIIKENCLNNEGSCLEFAKIKDRILVNANKEQLYGMQFTYDDQRNLIPFPIQKPELVDQRRKEIGLEPLKKYLKRKINYNFNVPQTKI